MQVLRSSTFCLLVDSVSANPKSLFSLGNQLAVCLSNGAIPVFISAGSGTESLIFPLWEILEPLWHQAVLFLPRARLPQLLPLLRDIDTSTRVEMQRQVHRFIHIRISLPHVHFVGSDTLAETLGHCGSPTGYPLSCTKPSARLTTATSPCYILGSRSPHRWFPPRNCLRAPKRSTYTSRCG